VSSSAVVSKALSAQASRQLGPSNALEAAHRELRRCVDLRLKVAQREEVCVRAARAHDADERRGCTAWQPIARAVRAVGHFGGDEVDQRARPGAPRVPRVDARAVDCATDSPL
jgi:hypothetical protein